MKVEYLTVQSSQKLPFVKPKPKWISNTPLNELLHTLHLFKISQKLCPLSKQNTYIIYMKNNKIPLL